MMGGKALLIFPSLVEGDGDVEECVPAPGGIDGIVKMTIHLQPLPGRSHSYVVMKTNRQTHLARASLSLNSLLLRNSISVRNPLQMWNIFKIHLHQRKPRFKQTQHLREKVLMIDFPLCHEAKC